MSDNHFIITISREFCSGGQRVAAKLAADLGVKMYDEDLLSKASEESGISKELFKSHDEKPTNSFLYSLVMDTYSFNYAGNAYSEMPINQQIFLAQFETIKKIAAKESCVILGRCADYALEEMEECTTVFLCADYEDRLAFASEHFGLSTQQAKERIKKEDKSRSSYYNFYTDKKWGSAAGYDLCLNTSALGIDGTAEMIEAYVTKRYNI